MDPSAHSVAPMEDSRLQVPEQAIRDYFAKLFETVSGALAYFVFNMDEMRDQTWPDAREITCFICSEYEGSTIPYSVSRTGQEVTLIACIAVDGSFLRLDIEICRKTFGHEFLLHRFTSDKVQIYHGNKGYLDLQFFNDWITDTFVPDLIARRQKWSYRGLTFLTLDNCPVHHGQAFTEMCDLPHVIMIWFPLHASNQLQLLDLCIFGLTKRLIPRGNRLQNINLQADRLVRILTVSCPPLSLIMLFRVLQMMGSH
jgi:hypothetical protein